MDDLSESLLGAEGVVDAENATRQKNYNENCLNCGTKLLDKFCHHCGQKDIPRRQMLGELWMNFFSSFFDYEGKFFLTTKYLITRPGFLAVEYTSGRRDRYYHPARMYASISFLFFLVFFSLPDSEKNSVVQLSTDDGKTVVQNNSSGDFNDFDEDDDIDSTFTKLQKKDSSLAKILTPALADSIKKSKKGSHRNKNKFNIADADFTSIESYDSAELTKPEAERDGWFKRKMVLKSIDLNNRYGKDIKSFGKEFTKVFMDNFSKVLFFLLPIFALVLKLMYVRRDFFYSEHLVFSTYYYSFFYLMGSVQMLIGQISWLEWITDFIGLWIFFYLLFAMKRMYKQSWGKTIAKFSLFSFVFLFFACFALAFAGIVILIIM